MHASCPGGSLGLILDKQIISHFKSCRADLLCFKKRIFSAPQLRGKMGAKSTLSLMLVPLMALPCIAMMSGPESCDYCVLGMTAFGEFAQGDLAGIYFEFS